MNGATAEPFARTSSPPNRNITRMIGQQPKFLPRAHEAPQPRARLIKTIRDKTNSEGTAN